MNVINIYVGIVSHGHENFIFANSELQKIARMSNVTVLIKDNLNSVSLQKHCTANGYLYLSSTSRSGFGKNNNIIFEFIMKNFELSTNDFFLVLNPDVFIFEHEFKLYIDFLSSINTAFSTINLYRDQEFRVYDPRIRKFPRFSDFFKSFLLGRDYAYDRSYLRSMCNIDWASGAFLCFSFELYSQLKGFDEDFFMYCEDIDICFRAYHLGYPLLYIPHIKAVHPSQYANRSMFSKHFLYHAISIIKYLYKRRDSA